MKLHVNVHRRHIAMVIPLSSFLSYFLIIPVIPLSLAFGITNGRNGQIALYSATRTTSNNHHESITLPQYLRDKSVNQELSNIICATAMACIEISQELQRLSLPNRNNSKISDIGGKVNVQGEVQKEMDVIANEIFKSKVQESVIVMASEEEEEIISGSLWDTVYSIDQVKNDEIGSAAGGGDNQGYEIAFDPLDGSSNLDVNIPTG